MDNDNMINITIPLSKEALDTYFDEIEKHAFVIDYEKSEYKNKLFLNYIYNSGMICDIEFKSLSDELGELLVEYIKYKRQLNIHLLNSIWNSIILYYLKKECDDSNVEEFFISFIDKNKDLVEELVNVLFSLKVHLFNITMVNNKGVVDGATEKTYTLLGENFISLRNVPTFWLNIALLDEMNLPVCNYTNFEKMSFNGKKIIYYFLNEFSPFSMLVQLKNEEELKMNDSN